MEKLEKNKKIFLDSQTSQQIQLLVGIFQCLIQKRTDNQLLSIPEQLINFNPKNAILPTFIAVNKRYELESKLRLIAPKLRQQLRRQAELISIGHIQEMDAYCLRDYTRRPGHNAIQKAGSKQRLMGVKRYQDHNTPENKFLVYFATRILHLEAVRYQSSPDKTYEASAKSILDVIEVFKQEEAIKSIQAYHYQLTRPNYVLLQNPIYNSFYQAYLDLINQRSQKQSLWRFRHALLADAIYLVLLNTLLHLNQAVADPMAKINVVPYPEQGRYLTTDNTEITIRVYLQQCVSLFRLRRFPHSLCDLQLYLEVHDLESHTFAPPKSFLFSAWIFWYSPSKSLLQQAITYLENNQQWGLIFYLDSTSTCVIPDPWLENAEEIISPKILCSPSPYLYLVALPLLTPNASLLPWMKSLVTMLQSLITDLQGENIQ